MAVARHFNVNFGLPQISFGFSGPRLCKYWLVVENRVFQRYRRIGDIPAARANDRFRPRLRENARDWRPDCVRSDIGEDLADRRGKISRIEPREHLMTF